jgi:MoeA C-terminal region (domain IV)
MISLNRAHQHLKKESFCDTRTYRAGRLDPVSVVIVHRNTSKECITWIYNRLSSAKYDNGLLFAVPLRSMGRLEAMATANALIEIPEGCTMIKEGTLAEAWFLTTGGRNMQREDGSGPENVNPKSSEKKQREKNQENNPGSNTGRGKGQGGGIGRRDGSGGGKGRGGGGHGGRRNQA